MIQRIAEFLYLEAELLDAAAWDDWLDLFTDDARYWVPNHPAQTDPLGEVSLYYEDLALMQARIGRLRHPRAMGVPTRTSHVVGNVRLIGTTPGGELEVRSRFQMIEFIDDEKRLHGGAVTHHLAETADGFRIRLKRVDLVDASGVFGLLQTFF